MITTLLFDLGGTLHTTRTSPELHLAFAKRLIDRLGEYGITIDSSPEELGAYLKEQGDAYKRSTEVSMLELPQARVWNEFYLARYHIGEEKLAPIAEELSFLYDYDRVRNMRRPHLKETMEELHAMGIRLGIISNIISFSVVPHLLMEYGIDHLMEVVVTSSGAVYRKPDRRIFDYTLEKLGVTPEETGYVGDTVSRDVRGTRNAGLGLCIQIDNPSLAAREAAMRQSDWPDPDYYIYDFADIPGIIRKINGQ